MHFVDTTTMRQTPWRCFVMALIAATCGCSLVPTGKLRNLSADRQSASEFDVVNRVDSSPKHFNDEARELEVSEMKPGQHVRLLTSTGNKREPGHVATVTTQYAGTISSVDSEHVVLCDVVKIEPVSRMTGVPIMDKVPYFNRLFKNSGVAMESTVTPGEVTILRSQILSAVDLLEGGMWIPEDGGKFSRIGVDFDESGKTELFVNGTRALTTID